MREKCSCQRESIRLHLATPLGGGGGPGDWELAYEGLGQIKQN